MKKENNTLFVLVIIIILTLYLWAYAENDLSFKVPAPPSGSLLDTQILQLGGREINTVLYNSDKDKNSIAEYYGNFFTQKEFEKILDETNVKTKKQLLRFKKDDLVVSIAIMPKADKTEVVVAKYLQPAGTLPPEKIKPSLKDSIFALPKEDVAGKDLSILPRPPDSVRMLDIDSGSEVSLMYSTTLPLEKTIDFYKTNMAEQEWTLANEVAVGDAVNAYQQTTGNKDLGIKSPFSDGEDFQQLINDSYVLNFTSDYGTARLTIFPNFIDRKSGSMVQIIYNKKE